MPAGRVAGKASYSNHYYNGRSYVGINEEIMWVSIGMGVTIAILITIALCYIAREKCQKRQPNDIEWTTNILNINGSNSGNSVAYSAHKISSKSGKNNGNNNNDSNTYSANIVNQSRNLLQQVQQQQQQHNTHAYEDQQPGQVQQEEEHQPYGYIQRHAHPPAIICGLRVWG